MSSEDVFDVLVKVYQDLKRAQKKLQSLEAILSNLDENSLALLDKLKKEVENIERCLNGEKTKGQNKHNE